MNNNPYKHLLEQFQNQSDYENENQNKNLNNYQIENQVQNQNRNNCQDPLTVVTESQQQYQIQQYNQQNGQFSVNTQANVFNPQQQIIQQQQAPQYSPEGPQVSEPLEVSMQNNQIIPPITNDEGVTNQNQFMLTIVMIYIAQYSFQIGFVMICPLFQSSENAFLQDNQITVLFWIVFVATILIPPVVFQVKELQHNPQSAICLISYLIVFSAFQLSLWTIRNKKTYNSNGDSISFGNYFWIGIFEIAQIIFNILGLAQLIALAILLKIRGDKFRVVCIIFKISLEFYIIGAILSIIGSIPFQVDGKIAFVIVVAAIGVLFTFWFSFALQRVTDQNFGLKQNQAVFGAFSVFVVMACPCVTKV